MSAAWPQWALAEPVPDYLSREFGLAQAKAELIASEVQLAADKYSLPPALLLAIISIESRFQEKARGTHGATGLMQVVPSAHRGLLRGVKDLTEPRVNIDKGSAILHGYVQAAGGDLKAGLKSYGGSRAYAEKVKLRTKRFERVVGTGAGADDAGTGAVPGVPDEALPGGLSATRAFTVPSAR
ncbi:transglycosylase SLT domain-containing protein [Paraburkholderia hayleyella]|uniref:transglycosylase SLT domain-containing protein n=1 Tax=Paraburkholderia hayleyella TaxID=2152889 RepID=UPI003CCDFA16